MFTPNFTISPKILNNLTSIAEIRAIIERSKVLPEREALLRRQAIGRMVHASTSIEGNQLAEYEVEKVLAGKPVRAEERQVLEVKNYQRALKKVWDIAQKKEVFTSDDILELHCITTHNLVVKQKCGHFRPGPVFVANIDGKKEEIIYTAPVANDVPKLIQDLINWLDGDEAVELNPVLTAGILHYQFVTIHPFTDGNGRMTRLLTLLHLAQNEYDFKKILILEEYYNNDRKNYYEALDTGDTYENRIGKNLTNWLEYFTTGFLAEAQKVKSEIMSMGFAKSMKDSEQIYLDRDEIKIMDFLASMGRVTSQDVMDILEIPKRTAQAKLKSLSDNRLIIKRGKGPSTYYTLKS